LGSPEGRDVVSADAAHGNRGKDYGVGVQYRDRHALLGRKFASGRFCRIEITGYGGPLRRGLTATGRGLTDS